MVSILVPAYNEQNVIGATLRALTSQPSLSPLEIIVACNGCKDKTAEVARSVSGPIRVVEIERAGKHLALNAADALASSFPRLYVDADIVVSPGLVVEIERALSTSNVMAAWPSVRYALEFASMSVRAYYRVWTSLPYNTPGRIGVGMYSLNEAARQRFVDFPNIISDDGYIRGLYAPNERVVVEQCYTTVEVPRTLAALIHIRTRSRLGVYELRRTLPEVVRQHRTQNLATKRSFGKLLNPQVVASMPIYLYVNMMSRWKAAQRLREQIRGSAIEWNRDETSRVAKQ